MKETEVQVGDWVYLYAPDEDGKEKQYIGKVCAFSNHGGLGLDGDCDIEYDVEYCDAEYFDSTEPIPLTLSLLSANDWILASGKMVLKGKSIRLGWDIKTHKFYIGYGELPDPVEYVHQVQHILRVCGMEEEANDFVLE